jgi:hypothetical protein
VVFCRNFGDDLRNFQCGLVGRQWHKNRLAHLNWCIGLEHIWGVKGHAEPEEYSRAQQLATCLCQRYADEAVRAASENRDRNCKLTGGRWLIDRDAHFGWRLTVHNDARIAETNARGLRLPLAVEP